MSEIFNPGDKVEFLDDKTRGTVISILDKNRLLIKLDEGLEIPVFKNELIKREAARVVVQRPVQTSINISELKKEAEMTGIFLALTESGIPDKYNLYLVNDTNQRLFFSFYEKSGDKYYGISNGSPEPLNTQIVTQINAVSGTQQVFFFQGIIFSKEFPSKPEPLEFTLTVSEKTFLQVKENCRILNKMAIAIYIKSTRKEQKTLKTDLTVSNESRTTIEKPLPVTDLHIEKIASDHKYMSRNEMLNYQFTFFENTLEKAIALNYPRIVFIHGIGTGSLKSRIHDFLKHNPHISWFGEANVVKYGYGATEIILKK